MQRELLMVLWPRKRGVPSHSSCMEDYFSFPSSGHGSSLAESNQKARIGKSVVAGHRGQPLRHRVVGRVERSGEANESGPTTQGK